MRLIIEHQEDGEVFVYRETNKQYKRVQKHRRGRRKTLKECDEDCVLGAGEYLVVKIKKGKP